MRSHVELDIEVSTSKTASFDAGYVPADLDWLAIGFPKIGVLMFGCSSELEFECDWCWIL